METAISIFGFFAFVISIVAYHKADKIEKELKKRKLFDQDFSGDK